MLEKYRQYLNNNDLLPRTIEAYCYDVNRFLTHFPDSSSLTPKDISEHIRRLGVGSKAKKRYLSAVSSYYTFLMEEGIVNFNPVSGVRRPRVRVGSPKFLTKFEIDAVRMSCPNILFRTIVDTFYFTGIRREELRTCQLTSLDLEKREIKVTGKGDKIRFVPFPSSLLPLYQEYLEHRSGLRVDDASKNYLFVSTKGRQFNGAGINYLIGKLGKLTGIKVTPHMFRHTFATHAIERGMTRQAVKEILGHRSVSTTDWYVHIEPDVRSDYDKAFK